MTILTQKSTIKLNYIIIKRIDFHVDRRVSHFFTQFVDGKSKYRSDYNNRVGWRGLFNLNVI